MSALCGHVFRLEIEKEIIITSTIQKLIFDKSLESTTIISGGSSYTMKPHHFQVGAYHTHGPNVEIFQVASGGQWCFIF